jgi:CRP/FNR family transcriptional regulator, cyclic AMP receptor protein
MMLTVEKVMFLRSVEIFSSIHDEYLADVARRMKEVRLTAGEPLFKRNDIGNLMYVIVKGKMRIHLEDRIVAELGELDVLGEMAALDPEPRSASATAIEDTYLLTLSHHDIRDLMEVDVEVAMGLIRTLCRRLRKVIAS